MRVVHFGGAQRRTSTCGNGQVYPDSPTCLVALVPEKTLDRDACIEPSAGVSIRTSTYRRGNLTGRLADYSVWSASCVNTTHCMQISLPETRELILRRSRLYCKTPDSRLSPPVCSFLPALLPGAQPRPWILRLLLRLCRPWCCALGRATSIRVLLARLWLRVVVVCLLRT
jgi:hypothetical protein